MHASDFEYDGKLLSQFGFVIGEIGGSSGNETIDTGYDISFVKVKRNGGRKYGVAATHFEKCAQTTFTILKDPDACGGNQEIASDEYRDIVRWLNRHQYLKFRLVGDECYEMETCFYNASFNIKKVMFDGRLMALELTADTDSPFGHGTPVKKAWDMNANIGVELVDYSDDAGFFIPDMKITCGDAGDLTITNDLSGSSMEIKNCTAGEVITIYGSTQIISTSVASHAIYNDFNYDFLKIGNTYRERVNTITATKDITLEMSYAPSIKDVP